MKFTNSIYALIGLFCLGIISCSQDKLEEESNVSNRSDAILAGDGYITPSTQTLCVNEMTTKSEARKILALACSNILNSQNREDFLSYLNSKTTEIVPGRNALDNSNYVYNEILLNKSKNDPVTSSQTLEDLLNDEISNFTGSSTQVESSLRSALCLDPLLVLKIPEVFYTENINTLNINLVRTSGYTCNSETSTLENLFLQNGELVSFNVPEDVFIPYLSVRPSEFYILLDQNNEQAIGASSFGEPVDRERYFGDDVLTPEVLENLDNAESADFDCLVGGPYSVIHIFDDIFDEIRFTTRQIYDRNNIADKGIPYEEFDNALSSRPPSGGGTSGGGSGAGGNTNWEAGLRTWYKNNYTWISSTELETMSTFGHLNNQPEPSGSEDLFHFALITQQANFGGSTSDKTFKTTTALNGILDYQAVTIFGNQEAIVAIFGTKEFPWHRGLHADLAGDFINEVNRQDIDKTGDVWQALVTEYDSYTVQHETGTKNTYTKGKERKISIGAEFTFVKLPLTVGYDVTSSETSSVESNNEYTFEAVHTVDFGNFDIHWLDLELHDFSGPSTDSYSNPDESQYVASQQYTTNDFMINVGVVGHTLRCEDCD